MDKINIKRSLAELSDDPHKALLFILDCYTPTSSKYTFSFTFKSIINDKPVPSVIKGFDELNERISLQRNTLNKLNNANQFLKQKLNNIHAQHQVINEKLNKAIEKTRKLFVLKGENEKIFKIKNKFLLLEKNKPLMLNEEKKKEALEILRIFNKTLEKMKEELLKK
ncbi:hypothetical protein TUBRATIS_30060 [Tubulinosema ratisbonensis]|uniref:Uncharacterized protein n=1 Tax=Tubulinosema ratisbonensis TaxID=291195 RepID=A0A437AHC4_9MICR|nr:hypothetical protein TUBRATIS_30060 [Tubulinosema ratisbonensis]